MKPIIKKIKTEKIETVAKLKTLVSEIPLSELYEIRIEASRVDFSPMGANPRYSLGVSIWFPEGNQKSIMPWTRIFFPYQEGEIKKTIDTHSWFTTKRKDGSEVYRFFSLQELIDALAKRGIYASGEWRTKIPSQEELFEEKVELDRIVF